MPCPFRQIYPGMSPDLGIEILVQQKSLILFFFHKGIAVVTWYVLLTTRNKYIHVCLTSLKALCTESIGTSTIQCQICSKKIYACFKILRCHLFKRKSKGTSNVMFPIILRSMQRRFFTLLLTNKDSCSCMSWTIQEVFSDVCVLSYNQDIHTHNPFLR